MPGTNDWLIISVRGFTIADDRNFNNFTKMSSWPDEFLVRNVVIYLVTSPSSTRLKVNDDITRSFRYVSYSLLLSVFISAAYFGPTLQKNSLNLLHMSALSITVFDPTMFSSNSIPFLFDLKIFPK